MGHYTLTPGRDLILATDATNTIDAPTDTLSSGDIIVALPDSDTTLVLQDGNRFDLAAPALLFGIDTVRDGSFGDSVITLRDGLDLTLSLGADAAQVMGADNADRIVGGAGQDTIMLGSARESVLAGNGGADIRMDTATAGARIDGAGRATVQLTGRYGDAVVLDRRMTGVAELDVASSGLVLSLGDAGVAAVALSASMIRVTAGVQTGLITDYVGGNSITLTGPDQTVLLSYAGSDPDLAPDRVSGFGVGDGIDVDLPYGPDEQLAYDAGDGQLTLTDEANGVRALLLLAAGLPDAFRMAADAGLPSGEHGTMIRLDAPDSDTDAPCFAAGTRVLSQHGWTRVEDLAVGDKLITASRRRRVLRWIGWRDVDCRRHPSPDNVLPIRITAGAFGHDLPRCDIRLSPDHGVYVDGVLIPARYLVNGATILRETVETIRYYHLELSSHDVLLAENLPVESYLDTGNRHRFANGGAAIALHADFAPPGDVVDGWSARGCAPLVKGGAVLRRARARLLGRADTLGYEMTQDPDLYLRADGQRIWGRLAGGVWSGWLPPGTRRVCIVSRAAAPTDCAVDTDDRRRLGVALRRIVLRAGGTTRRLEAAMPDWGSGVYPMEADAWASWRWTDGCAELPASLWDGLDAAFRLDLHIFRTLTYRCEDMDPVARLAM